MYLYFIVMAVVFVVSCVCFFIYIDSKDMSINDFDAIDYVVIITALSMVSALWAIVLPILILTLISFLIFSRLRKKISIKINLTK